MKMKSRKSSIFHYSRTPTAMSKIAIILLVVCEALKGIGTVGPVNVYRLGVLGKEPDRAVFRA
jgi:hypothetical protein